MRHSEFESQALRQREGRGDAGHGKDQVLLLLEDAFADSVLMPEERGPQPDKGPGLPGRKPLQSERGPASWGVGAGEPSRGSRLQGTAQRGLRESSLTPARERRPGRGGGGG